MKEKKSRYREIKIKPKEYRVSGRHKNNIVYDLIGTIAVLVITLFVNWLYQNGYLISFVDYFHSIR